MGELGHWKFWLAAFERAVKSFAGGILTGMGSNAINLTELDWPQILGVASFYALTSILLSIVSAGVGNSGPSSFGPEQLKEAA